MATENHSLYDGKVILRFTEGNHRYKLLEPVERTGYKQGVSTVGKLLNKPELMQWASNKAVDAFVEAYRLSPVWTEEQFKELCKTAKYAHSTYKDARAEVGKNVHSWIEAHIKGETFPLDELMKPSVDAFMRWESSFKPQYVYSEKLLYSMKHDYCGTMDCGAIIDGMKTLIDFKTGDPEKEYNAYQKRYTGRVRGRLEHFMQEAGYNIPLNEELKWGADQLMTLYLPLDGSLNAFKSEFVEFWEELFIQVLELGRRLQKANKLNDFEWRT